MITSDLMREFLEEFRAGTIPNTYATRNVAAEFALHLEQPTKGRGRPKKSRGFPKALKQKIRGDAKGRTVERMLFAVLDRLDSGLSWKATLSATATEFGITADGVRKNLNQPELDAGSAQKFSRVAKTLRSIRQLGKNLRANAIALGLGE